MRIRAAGQGMVFWPHCPKQGMVLRYGLPTEVISNFQIVSLREKIINALAETYWDEWDVEEYM